MSNIKFTIDKNGVANIAFDLPNEKVNKLSESVMLELEKALNVIDGNKAARILLITSEKKDVFIAGADINEIKAIKDQRDAFEKVSHGQNLISKIAQLKIPTIAVINGACLGGGLELALACKYRVAVLNPKTVLGLPEVNLGIIPGFGGTQRLPRLVGVEEALKIILSGKAIDAAKAFKIGLVDDIIREEFLEEKLSHFVTEIIKNGDQNVYLTKREKLARQRFVVETLLLKKHLVFYFAKRDLFKKTKGNYPAPFCALEVIRRTYGLTYNKRGFEVELDAFCQLAVGDISKNLIEIFFTNEELKKDDGLGGSKTTNVQERVVKNVALLGAGIMGGGIAWLFANHDINVRIKDVTQNAINIGLQQVLKIFNQLKKIKKLTQGQINLKLDSITSNIDFIGFKDADFVIEAVVENMAVKKTVLAEVENKIKKDAVIVSNTSSLSISEMAHALQNPERFAGMHFFNPVNKMPLVEVIYGDKTSDETIVKVVKLAKRLGKTPIVVKDVSGFLVNRILLPYMNEAACLLQGGAEIARIDKVIENYGMPMGPFILADVVGIDVGCKVAQSLQEAYGSRMRVAEILTELHKNHKELLGKKSKKGFYIYDSENALPRVNSEIAVIVEGLKNKDSKQEFYISDKEILDRCILIMCNEAAKCLEEGVVKNARYLDMAMIMGAGFPAFRGGLLRYVDAIGAKEIVATLKEFEKKFGERFKASALLVQMASDGKKFY